MSLGGTDKSWEITTLQAKECHQLGQLTLEGRAGHEQSKDIADGHADPQGGGALVALVDVLAPDQQQDEQAAQHGGSGDCARTDHNAGGNERRARKLGYSTLICTTEDDPKVEKDCLSRLRSGFVDGIILAGTGRNGRLVRDIQASGISMLQIVRCQDARISSIVADYRVCGADAAKYLRARGCRKLGLINGSFQYAPYKERYEGFTQAVEALGLEAHFCESDRPINSFEYGYDCANQLLDETPDLDAILAAVDVQGLGAIRAVTQRGLRIPDQIKIISLTGHEIGAMLQTTMTSMEMPAQRMGDKAAQMIIEEIESGAGPDQRSIPQHLSFTMQLEEREST